MVKIPEILTFAEILQFILDIRWVDFSPQTSFGQISCSVISCSVISRSVTLVARSLVLQSLVLRSLVVQYVYPLLLHEWGRQSPEYILIPSWMSPEYLFIPTWIRVTVQNTSQFKHEWGRQSPEYLFIPTWIRVAESRISLYSYMNDIRVQNISLFLNE